MRVWNAGRYLTDLVLPPRCPVCGEVAPYGKKACPECLAKLPVIRGNRCIKCSKPVESGETYCRDCARTEHLYTQGFAAMLYDDVTREILSGLKYEGRRENANLPSEITYEEAEGVLERWNPHVLLPVPLHINRLRKRTYNQAEEIARVIGKRSGIAVMPDLLERKTETDALKTLDRKERAARMRDVFRVPEDVSVPERVCVVDDIYTTGSTVDAASYALLAAGARNVYFLTVCIGSGFMVRY